MRFSADEANRYARQVVLSDWGIEGQRAVRASAVRLPDDDEASRLAALWLAGAGIGTLEGPVGAEELALLNPHVGTGEVEPAVEVRPRAYAAGLNAGLVGDAPSPDLLAALAASDVLLGLVGATR